MTHTREDYLAARADLHNATNAVHDALVELEAALAALQLGMRVAVPLDGGLGQVAYDKAGGHWRLLWIPPDGACVTLDAAPRSIRVAAAPVLGALLDRMITDTPKHTLELRQAAAAIRAVADRARELPDAI